MAAKRQQGPSQSRPFGVTQRLSSTSSTALLAVPGRLAGLPSRLAAFLPACLPACFWRPNRPTHNLEGSEGDCM